MDDANIVKTYSFKDGNVFLCSNSFASTKEEREKALKGVQLCANRIIDSILTENSNKQKKKELS